MGSEMGVTHGLLFECATSESIGVLGMCLYIPWLDVYHFLSAQSLKCTFPTPVSTQFSKKSELTHLLHFFLVRDGLDGLDIFWIESVG